MSLGGNLDKRRSRIKGRCYNGCFVNVIGKKERKKGMVVVLDVRMGVMIIIDFDD